MHRHVQQVHHDETKFKSMEEKRTDALEMAEEADAQKKEGNETQNSVSSWEYGVTRYPNGLQLGYDIIWVL